MADNDDKFRDLIESSREEKLENALANAQDASDLLARAATALQEVVQADPLKMEEIKRFGQPLNGVSTTTNLLRMLMGDQISKATIRQALGE